MRLVHRFTDGDHPVELYQNTPNTFKVVYGNHSRRGLSYEEAAREYGQCVFHSLACADKMELK